MGLSYQIDEQVISNVVQDPGKGLISYEIGLHNLQAFLELEKPVCPQNFASTPTYSYVSARSHHMFCTQMIEKLVPGTWTTPASFDCMKSPKSLTSKTKTHTPIVLSSFDLPMDCLCTPHGFGFIPNLHVDIYICVSIREIEASHFLVLFKHHFCVKPV